MYASPMHSRWMKSFSLPGVPITSRKHVLTSSIESIAQAAFDRHGRIRNQTLVKIPCSAQWAGLRSSNPNLLNFVTTENISHLRFDIESGACYRTWFSSRNTWTSRSFQLYFTASMCSSVWSDFMYNDTAIRKCTETLHDHDEGVRKMKMPRVLRTWPSGPNLETTHVLCNILQN